MGSTHKAHLYSSHIPDEQQSQMGAPPELLKQLINLTGGVCYRLDLTGLCSDRTPQGESKECTREAMHQIAPEEHVWLTLQQ